MTTRVRGGVAVSNANETIEPLEARQLRASVHPQPAFRLDAHGTLRVSGSAGNDTVVRGGRSGDVRLQLNDRRLTITRPVDRAIVYGGDDELTDDWHNVLGRRTRRAKRRARLPKGSQNRGLGRPRWHAL